MKTLTYKIKWKKHTKFIILITLLVAGGIFIYHQYFANKAAAETSTTSIFEKVKNSKTIQNVLSGTGTVQPLNTYDVTTLVEGKVIAADFEEGDTVEKGQILYRISTDDIDSQITAAQKKVDRAAVSIAKAKEIYFDAVNQYDQAVADYKKAKEEYGDSNVKSKETGIVKALYVEEGDTYQRGTQIAEIYDNSCMLLKVPFPSSEADDSFVGKTAEITIEDSFETVKGKVTKVSSINETLLGNRVVKEVTIKVNNPGCITETTTATAAIEDIYSASTGSFCILTDAVITADVTGEIDTLNIKEGDSVKEGEVIFTLTQDSVDKQLQTYSKAVDTAQISVENASDSTETAKETLEDAEASLEDIVASKTDYSITAPSSGRIISKNILVGDTISSENSTIVCSIYNLSAVTFCIYVDELDIGEVEIGDAVNVTADALGDTKITGKVINYSLLSKSSSGVTQYPVTVQIDDVGDLLPGMNVTGDIVVEETKDCIAIPNVALMRDNLVYIKDESVTEAVGDIPVGCKGIEVTTGITDGDYIEILSGLDGTEEVYIGSKVNSISVTGGNSLLDGLFSKRSIRKRSFGINGGRSSGGRSSQGGRKQ